MSRPTPVPNRFPPLVRRLLVALAVGGGWAALVLAGTEVFARPAAAPPDPARPAIPADHLADLCETAPDAVRQYQERHTRLRMRVRADRVSPVPGRYVRVEHHARGRVVACRVPWSYRDQVREGGEVTVEGFVLAADDRQVDMGHAVLQ